MKNFDEKKQEQFINLLSYDDIKEINGLESFDSMEDDINKLIRKRKIKNAILVSSLVLAGFGLSYFVSNSFKNYKENKVDNNENINTVQVFEKDGFVFDEKILNNEKYLNRLAYIAQLSFLNNNTLKSSHALYNINDKDYQNLEYIKDNFNDVFNDFLTKEIPENIKKQIDEEISDMKYLKDIVEAKRLELSGR